MTFKVENSSSISSNNINITFQQINIYCFPETYITVLVVAALILPINICAMWHGGRTIKTNKNYTSSDVLSFNLVVNSVALFMPPVLFYASFYLSNILLFTAVQVLTITCIEAQAHFQTWICIEQYLAVVYPIFYLKLKRFKYVFVLVSFTWVISFVLGCLFVFLGSSHGVFVLLIPISVLLVPILFCSVGTLAALKQSGPSEGKKKDMHLKKQKAFKIIAMTLLVFTFCYYPYVCVTLLWNKLALQIICKASTVSLSFLFFGSVFHSLLYVSRFIKMPWNMLVWKHLHCC